MSKLPRSSICKFFPPHTAALLLIAGCLSPRAGQDETTEVVLTLDTTGASSGSSGDGGSTLGGIMTTTEDPDDDGSSSDDDGTAAPGTTSTTDGTTTTPIPIQCGDSQVQDDEQCDDGNDDDHDACTNACQTAVCGDGIVRADGVADEACDDTSNDGSYGGCMPGCAALAARCGDLEIQQSEGEECDASTPDAGCLKDQCKRATSCLDIKNSWGDEATDGTYSIWPKDQVTAYCDMTTDQGGYTFLKVAHTQIATAKVAETVCSGLGLRLLVPRSEGHLQATAAVAVNNAIAAVGGGPVPATPLKYLSIFGIYPKTEGQSCVGTPLNSGLCKAWIAGVNETYWVSDTAVPSQPGTDNCAGCSMSYAWVLEPGPVLDKYTAFSNGGDGATSQHFLCDVGDKLPQI